MTGSTTLPDLCLALRTLTARDAGPPEATEPSLASASRTMVISVCRLCTGLPGENRNTRIWPDHYTHS